MTPTQDQSILIVEDSAADLAVLVEALQHKAFRIIVAHSGEECLRHAAAVQPDLILLDVMLPGISGIEVCRRLKTQAETSELPVMLITARGDPAEKLAGFKAGGVDYIAKPFQIEEVLARVDTHIKLRGLQRQLEEQNAELQEWRSHLEQKIAAQTERLHLMSFALDHVRQAVYLIDEQACCRYANDRARCELGYSVDELRQMTVMDVAPKWTTVGWTRAWERLRELGAATLEDVHRRKDGTQFPVEVDASYIEFQGNAYAFMIVRDLSARTIAEQALQTSEQRFRLLAGNFPDMVVRFDRDCRVTYANPACRLLASPDNLLGLTPRDFRQPPEQIERIMASMQSVLATGVADQCEAHWPDGRIYELRHIPEKDDLGNVASILGIARDITQLRAAEEALRRSEREFRTLAENAPDVIVRYDRDCRRIYVNPAMVRLTGLPADQLLGRPADQLSGRTTDETMPLPSIPPVTELLLEVIASGKAVSRETHYRNLDGEMRWGYGQLIPELDSDGRVATVLLIARDVHDLKESEQRFRTLAENFPDIVVRFDRECRFTYVNPQSSIASGIPSEAYIGKAFRDLYPDTEQTGNTEKLLRRTIAEGITTYGEARLIGPDGERVWELRHVPEKDGAGNVTSVLGISRDVTQLRAAEDALRRSEREFRMLAENSPDNITRYDRFCRLVYANARLFELVGPALAEHLGKTPQEACPDGRYADYQTRLARMIETGQSEIFELTLPDTGAGARYHQIRMVAEHGPDGEITGALAVGTDVTERRQAERKLQAREQTFRTLVENSPDGIARYDRELRRLYVNPAMLNLFAQPEQEIIGAPADFSLAADPQPVIRKIRQVIETGVEVADEALYRTALGELRWAQIRLVPEFDAEGKVGTFLLVGRDIHVIKESESRFRTLADNFPDIIGRFDAGGCVIYANSSVSKILAKPPAAFVGKTMGELDPCQANAEAHAIATELIVRTFREDIGHTHQAAYRVRGVERVFEIRLVPERDVSGRVVSVLGVARDVTLRQQFEEGLLERAQLEQRMSAYFANAPGQFFTLIRRPDGMYTMPFGSPGIQDLHGVAPTDTPFPCTVLIALIHPDDLGHFVRIVEEANRAVTPFRCEYRIVHPRDGLRWIELRGVPRRDSDGSTVWHGFMHDTTDRFTAEETIRELNADLSATLRAIPDLLLEVDRNGRYHKVWAQDPALAARQQERLIDRTASDVMAPEVAATAMAAIREADVRGYSYGKTIRLDLRDGPRWFEMSVSKKNGEANPPRFLVLSREVTWRKRQEMREAMRSRVFENVAEGGELPATLALAAQYIERACPGFVCGVMLRDARTPYLQLAVAPSLADDAIAEVGGLQIAPTPEIRKLGPNLLVPIVDAAREVLGAMLIRPQADTQRSAPIDLELIHEASRLVGIAIGRRRMEEELAAREREFRTLAENSPYVIVRYDDECRRTYVNPEYERVNQLPASEAVGKRPTETATLLAQLAASFSRELKGAMVAGVAKNLDLCMTDPAPMWWNVRIVPEYDPHGGLVGALTIWNDITHRKEAERRLRESYDLLQELTSRRETAREEERKRVAREIHDELGQYLTALRLGISTLRLQFGQETPLLAERVGDMMLLADKTIQVVRDVAAALRPAVLDSGIGTALEWLAAEFRRRTGVPCQVDIPDERFVIDDNPAMTLFRVVQESLTNVARHAEAKSVWISLCRQNDGCVAEIRDDGKGFDSTVERRKSFGLMGMKERVAMLGGEIAIDSAPGCGTTIKARIPMGNKREEP